MADPQQWNMYAYVRNNPLLFVDPDGKELTLYLCNNTGGLSNQQLAQAGTGIANKFHDAGGKNVSYRVVDRVPVNLKHDGHSRFIEVTNGRDGKYWSLDKGTAGENPVGSNFNRARTYVQVDANASIRNQTPTTDDQRVNNLIEVGSHESAHGVLGHSDDPNNIMNSPWGSNRPFDTQQSQQLQSGFNRPGEVDSGVSCGQQSLACAGNSTPNSMPTPPTTPLSKPESNTSN